MNPLSPQDNAEALHRAKWLHSHRAPADWIVLTNTEVAVLKASLPYWRPIESAPRDGLVMLVWAAPHERAETAFWQPLHPHYGEGWKDASDIPLPYTPTHWMPLPQPPTS